LRSNENREIGSEMRKHNVKIRIIEDPSDDKLLQSLVRLDETEHVEELNDDYAMILERIGQMKLENSQIKGSP
jgi:hypothetical protein